jgi:histidinol phosphatase-like PHP family hydrolase
MQHLISRRGFLFRSTGTAALAGISAGLYARSTTRAQAAAVGFPLVDYHVHLDNSTVDKVVELSKQRGIRFGIVEHAGTKENKYPIVLSNDAELKAYLAMLDGKPVLKGIQAEWSDWMSCFSPDVLEQLDYVLSDAMTFPGPNGQRMKLWEKGAVIGEPEAFMDRYADWHVDIMAKQPLDILCNTSWLPDALIADYDRLWTPKRMQKVIDAAVKYQVALEISSSYKLPRLPFLMMAKAAGVKFSLGSNGRYPNMGKLEYSIQMAKALGLTEKDMFRPAPRGEKPFQRRKIAVGTRG